MQRNVYAQTECNADQLMHQFNGGNDEAFGELSKMMGPILQRWALKLLPIHSAGRAELADDLVADSLLKAMATRGQANCWQRHKGSVKGWLGTIVYNTVVSHLRRRGREAILATDLEKTGERRQLDCFGYHLVDYRHDAEAQAKAADRRRRIVLHAIKQLPESLKAVLEMKMKGMTHQQIAIHLDISKSSVTRRIRRARMLIEGMQAMAA